MREEEEEEEGGREEEEEDVEEEDRREEGRRNEGKRIGVEDEEWEEEGRTMDWDEKRKKRDGRRIGERKLKKKEEEERGVLITYSSLVLLKSRLEMVLFLREKEEGRKNEDERRRIYENEGGREESELNLSTSDLTIFKKGLQLGEIDRLFQFISEQGMKLDGRKELLLSLVEVIWREEDEDDAKAFLRLMESLMGGKEVRLDEGRKLEEEGNKLEEEDKGWKRERHGKDDDGDRREEVREAGEIGCEKAIEGQKLVFERLETWMKKYDEVGYLKLMCKFNQIEVK